MCYPPSDYIIFSSRKLKLYGDWGPGTERRITQTHLLNNFLKFVGTRALYTKTYLGICPKFMTVLSCKNIQRL